MRDELDFKNAAMIGYSASGLIGTDEGNYLKHTALGIDQRDEVNEIEQNRYFVVLMAYDFQLLWKERKAQAPMGNTVQHRRTAQRFRQGAPGDGAIRFSIFWRAHQGARENAGAEGQVDIGEVKSLGEVKPPSK
jgi:hypothetical protein